jgi:hypothetical protein
VDGGASLQALLDRYATQGPTAVGLRPGTYTLPAPLLIGSQSNGLTLHACQGGVVLAAPSQPGAEFARGLIALRDVTSVTLRGLELALPLAALALPTAGFDALPPGLHGVFSAYAAGLQAAIGVSVGGSAGLAIEDCTFTLGSLGQANVFAAGISASGTMRGTTITGCTFQCASPAATVPFHQLSTVAGTPQQPSAVPPYQLTFGYLQTAGPEAAPGVTQPLAQVLDDAVLERNQFLGVTVPVLALAQLGAIRVERNTASGAYGGLWLISLTGTAQQQSTFAQFPVADPPTYGPYASAGIAALADVILPLASQVGWVLPATQGGSPAAAPAGEFLQLDLTGNRVDATVGACGAGVVVADLSANGGSALIHGNRIATRFPGGAAALVAGVGEASITGNVIANAVPLPPAPPAPGCPSLVLNPADTPLGEGLAPPDKVFGDLAGVSAVAVTGNIFVNPTSLPPRPVVTPSLGDWDTLNPVFSYGLAAAPVVTQISPATGPAGTTVTITGTGFTGATAVSFGTIPATFALSGTTPDTELTAIVPAGAGTADVTVTTPSGSSPAVPADQFTFLTITSLSPSNGQPPLTVTIYGSGFPSSFSHSTTVSFGPNYAANVAVAPGGTQLTCVLPPGTGVVDVSVTVPGVGSPAVGPGMFSYLTVTRTNYPAGESVHFGGGVTLFGYGFIAGATTVTLTPAPATGGTTYTVASSQVQVSADGTQLGFASPFPPTAALGVYNVTVTTPNGTSPGGITLSYGGVHS